MDNTTEKKSFIKNSLSKIEHFFWSTKIKKICSSILIAIAIIIFAYTSITSNYYSSSNSPIIDDESYWFWESGWMDSTEEVAEILLLIGEKNIQNGNYQEALFGSDSIYYLPEEIKGGSIKFKGLNEIVSDSRLKKTSSVDAANYWIGVCYYKLGELSESAEEKVEMYQKAIDYLDRESDSNIFNNFKESQIGDCFSQLGDFEKALKYYQNALNTSNDIIKLETLFKAAETANFLAKNELAIKYYTEIINDFPKSQYVNKVNKKIAELLAKK